MKRVVYHFITCCTALLPALTARANDVDLKFIRSLVPTDTCHFDVEQFAAGFSAAIDRLNEINPALAQHIRSDSYRQIFNMNCNVERTAKGIYYRPIQRTIYLWKDMDNSWRTYASFFHEFLHFANVKIDTNYHNNPDPKNIVEVDSVYACHLAVFPELAPLVQLEPSRIAVARATCAKAEFDNEASL